MLLLAAALVLIQGRRTTGAAEAMDARCEDAGMNSEGIPTVRWEGMIKYLKLIGEER